MLSLFASSFALPVGSRRSLSWSADKGWRFSRPEVKPRLLARLTRPTVLEPVLTTQAPGFFAFEERDMRTIRARPSRRLVTSSFPSRALVAFPSSTISTSNTALSSVSRSFATTAPSSSHSRKFSSSSVPSQPRKRTKRTTTNRSDESTLLSSIGTNSPTAPTTRRSTSTSCSQQGKAGVHPVSPSSQLSQARLQTQRTSSIPRLTRYTSFPPFLLPLADFDLSSEPCSHVVVSFSY